MNEAAECLFCRIVAGEINAEIVYEDDACVAFRDIQPHAPVHVLVVPRKHIASLDDLGPEDAPLVGHVVGAAASIARRLGVTASGYRTVINCGEGGGQSVFHLHLHLLGGRVFGWPPG